MKKTKKNHIVIFKYLYIFVYFKHYVCHILNYTLPQSSTLIYRNLKSSRRNRDGDD